MTAPTNSPFPIEAPDLIGVGAQSIVDRAGQLGLTWTRRLATVVDGATDPANATIRFDNDKETVTAASMVGKLPTDARVYVDIVPPAANFITGVASLDPDPMFFGWANLSQVSAAGTTTSAAFVDVPGAPTITLAKNYVSTYIRLDFMISFFSTLGGTVAQFGIQFNATSDSNVVLFDVNVANNHVCVAASVIFAWAFNGNVTMKARWKRTAGGGTLTMDANDQISMTAVEMPPP